MRSPLSLFFLVARETPRTAHSQPRSCLRRPHLPRELHATILASIHGWLKPEGLLLLTVETEDEPGVTGQWLGVDMFFSSFDADTTRRLIREAGFEALSEAIEAQIEGEKEVSYFWVLARSMP